MQAGMLYFPLDFDPMATSLIAALLELDPDLRLGNLPGGAHDVESHPWFVNTKPKATQSLSASQRQRSRRRECYA